MKKIKLVLYGQPMSKQSVRQGRTKAGKSIFYQPAKYKIRSKDYYYQIIKQLPEDFQMFEKKVYIEKLKFCFQPLAAHKRSKKISAFLAFGGEIEKTTKPDLSDNLKKLLFDTFGGVVFKDDSLICKENNVSKVYAITAKIEIEISGE